MDKLERLKAILKNMGSVLVAYSGGVDSTFLLKVAAEALGDKVLAVTADSETYPKAELHFAKSTAKELKVRHKIIRTYELKDRDFASNPARRCYFCKYELFSRLKKIAKIHKLNFVADASNVSDKKDYRPGAEAKKELGVRSPLQEAGITKAEVRALSKRIGLVSWDKPSLACLASRIPYGTRITVGALKQIDEAETHLRKLGFKQVRARHYNGLCRIEVLKNEIPRLISKQDQVIDKLKKLGYNYITVDLEGYRTGSMNHLRCGIGAALQSRIGGGKERQL